jgi:hypothetical protein
MTMNLKQFIDYCEGNIEAVEKAINILVHNRLVFLKEDGTIDFEDFAETSVYVDGEWEPNAPPFG